MSLQDDRTFLRKFGGIILGLVVFTLLILALAFKLSDIPTSPSPSQQRLAEERIAPVAGVRAGAEAQAALDAAAAESQPSAAASGSEPATADGKQIYQTVCVACHGAGIANAPMPGSEAMAQRLAAKGLDGLLNSAINGLNVMPPRGGRPDLSDADLRAAIEFMQQ